MREMKHRFVEMAAIHGHLARDGPRVGFTVAIAVGSGRGGVTAYLQSTVARESRQKSAETSVGRSRICEVVSTKPLTCCKKVACDNEVEDGGSEAVRAEGETWRLRLDIEGGWVR